MKDILLAKDIAKIYFDSVANDDVVALDGVSLGIEAHDFVSVIGPSGCGKSTLLRIVAGLDRPTSGEILVSGKQVTGPGADRGMVFQEYALLPWKTTKANVEFGPRLNGVPKAQRAAIAHRFIDLVGLKGFENKYPHQLSGGMRQRAAVTSLPSIAIFPVSGVSRPATIRSNVDLPDPLGPSSATRRPVARSRSTPSMASGPAGW